MRVAGMQCRLGGWRLSSKSAAQFPVWSTQRCLAAGVRTPLAPALSACLSGRQGTRQQWQLQQTRASGGKQSRHGRLEHHRFGVLPVKGRYYYRFHKLIGKWNWRGYKERYHAPRALENRQRWIPTVRPMYLQARQANSWFWRLPSGLADAVTADEVLEKWILFRHKLPKKTYHYFKVLSRLCEVGGCDPSDWRLRFITSRLVHIHRKILNLPRLAKFYAQLKATAELEHLSRFLYPMLHKYPPRQLVLTAHAFGLARMQDKRLFSDIARLLEPKLPELTPAELVQVAQAFAAVEVCHYTFLTRLSAQVQMRVQQESEGQAPLGSTPSFAQIAQIAEAFASLKLQDYSYFEMSSSQAIQLLCEGRRGPTPPTLAQLCTAAAKLKIHDTDLFETVLAHAADHWYDYPAAALVSIGAAVAPVLPRDSPAVVEAYRRLFEVIRTDCDLLTLKDVELASRFMAEVDHKGEFMPGLAQVLAARVRELRDDSKVQYDVSRVAEIFARRIPEDRVLFSALCKHLHRHLGFFEPVDFIRFVRGLALTEYRDDRVTHALSRWACKRRAEFSQRDWEAFLSALESLGVGEKRTSRLKELESPVSLPSPYLPGVNSASSDGVPRAVAS